MSLLCCALAVFFFVGGLGAANWEKAVGAREVVDGAEERDVA
jgi:hypothetical protein